MCHIETFWKSLPLWEWGSGVKPLCLPCSVPSLFLTDLLSPDLCIMNHQWFTPKPISPQSFHRNSHWSAIDSWQTQADTALIKEVCAVGRDEPLLADLLIMATRFPEQWWAQLKSSSLLSAKFVLKFVVGKPHLSAPLAGSKAALLGAKKHA